MQFRASMMADSRSRIARYGIPMSCFKEGSLGLWSNTSSIMSRAPRTRCGKCGEPKPIDATGRSRCRPCLRQSGRAYYERSATRRQKMRAAYVLRRYGTSIEQLESLLERQRSRCAICGLLWYDCKSAKSVRHERHFLQHLCVDHDHVTGAVRGLLCNACNTGIALFAEDERRFHAACAYVRAKALR